MSPILDHSSIIPRHLKFERREVVTVQRSRHASTVFVEEPFELESVAIRPNLDKSSRPEIGHDGVNWLRGGHALQSTSPSALGDAEGHFHDDRNADFPLPRTATVDTVETWSTPRINVYRVGACFYSFFVFGLNDASSGPLIPYLEEYYNLSYTVISLVFLFPFVGYIAAAMLNNMVQSRFGQRGIAFLGSACRLVAYVTLALHPLYPICLVAFAVAGLGGGFEESGWNPWLGAMDHANELLGLLHGSFGLGATLAPLIATSIITRAHRPWYTWYYVMIVMAILELGVCLHSFWAARGSIFRAANARSTGAEGSRLREAILMRPAARVTWMVAFFLLGYVGTEIAIGGWIVTFMIKIRHGAAFASGMSATGFWLGITLGRVVLGFVTPRIGETLAISIYLPIACGMQLLFWLVLQFYVSIVAVSLVGFFLGPLFPAAMVVCTKQLPKHLHVSGIGFAAALGGSGGAILPFAVGAVAQEKGVQVLQPIVVGLMAVIWCLWLCLPRTGKRRD